MYVQQTHSILGIYVTLAITKRGIYVYKTLEKRQNLRGCAPYTLYKANKYLQITYTNWTW